MNPTILPLVIVALSATAAGAASDKLNITPAEHAACDGDAANLCADSYPDEDKLLACMKIKRSQLSASCSAAFIAGMKKRHIPL